MILNNLLKQINFIKYNNYNYKIIKWRNCPPQLHGGSIISTGAN